MSPILPRFLYETFIDCLEHQPKTASDWECPERVLSILDLLLKPDMFDGFELEVSTDFNAVNTESIVRVHSSSYIKFVNELGKQLEVCRGVPLLMSC